VKPQAVITGVGHYAPPRRITNFDLEKMVETSDAWIRERTGIEERRVCDDGVATSDIAIEAARRALADAGVKAEDLDLVLLATASPDMLFPATSCIVQNALGAKKAGAVDLSSGCAGFVYALCVASQFICSGVYKRVLVIGADVLSRLTNWRDRNTCVLFGDGAGAAVVEPSTEGFGMMSFALRSDGSGGDLLKLPSGGSRLPASAETVAAGQHYIHMSGSEVFKFAVKAIGDTTNEVLQGAGLSVDDVDLFVPHQANMRIMTAAARRVGVPDEKVFTNVARYGNTSCASIAIALSEAVEQGRLRKNDVVALCGFGAGLSWGGAVMRWGYTRTAAPSPGHAPPAHHALQPENAAVKPCV
jgi:3-oxoacyl-[acyl-carrier-protein] synthase-3